MASSQHDAKAVNPRSRARRTEVSDDRTCKRHAVSLPAYLFDTRVDHLDFPRAANVDREESEA